MVIEQCRVDFRANLLLFLVDCFSPRQEFVFLQINLQTKETVFLLTTITTIKLLPVFTTIIPFYSLLISEYLFALDQIIQVPF